MLYTGIDYPKRYSVASIVDATGARIREARIEDNEPAAFAAYFKSLPEPSRVVVEACWNWGWLYDELGEIDRVEDVVLAHPFKTRLIADAQIKTDRLDARALATLLRGNLVATVHAPTPANRARKHFIRQRLFLVRVRTMLRNRVHTLIARQRGLDRPVFSDPFGKKGLHWLRPVTLPAPDDTLLQQDLATLEQLGTVIKALETQIVATNAADAAARRLQSLPGVGPILAAVMAAEIDGVSRFPRADKLCCYAGLVPTPHSSGGKTHHGRMLPFANRWLKWAFVEAAWVAIGCSSYFGGIYQRHRARGKKANTTITIIARRLCTIAWHLLHDGRDYAPNPPSSAAPPSLSPAAPAEN
jgi:transposase